MLDGQRMRAARVVFDIGVHLGLEAPAEWGGGTWDADKGWEFLQANVNMPEAFIRFEWNRYLGWPGQAPSYKIGQRLWEQARDAAAAPGRGRGRAVRPARLPRPRAEHGLAAAGRADDGLRGLSVPTTTGRWRTATGPSSAARAAGQARMIEPYLTRIATASSTMQRDGDEPVVPVGHEPAGSTAPSDRGS